MEPFTALGRTLTLARYPATRDASLRAWDTADEYLLDTFISEVGEQSDAPLILNDLFGALSVALSDRKPTVQTDSWLTQQAIQANLQRNQCPAKSVKLLPATETPKGTFSICLMRVPKVLRFFEYQLHLLRQVMPVGSLVVVGGMQKHLSPNTKDVMARYLDDVQVGLGRKKARVFTGKIPAEAVTENSDIS